MDLAGAKSLRVHFFVRLGHGTDPTILHSKKIPFSIYYYVLITYIFLFLVKVLFYKYKNVSSYIDHVLTYTQVIAFSRFVGGGCHPGCGCPTTPCPPTL